MRTLIIAVMVGLAGWSCLAQEQSDTGTSTAQKTAGVPEPLVKLDPKGEALPASVWMQQKLKHSKKIFEGMVRGDMAQVEESARHLKLLNRLESFVRRGSSEYRSQMTLFQHANNEIIHGAETENLDRVTLAFNQMTVSCVACHKQLRSAN